MNFKMISIFLAISFLAIGCVSAADDNATDETVLSAVDDNASLASVDEDVLSAVDDVSDEDVLSIVDDNASLASVDEDVLSAVDEDVSEGYVLSVSEDNASLSSAEKNQISVSVGDDSKLSASVAEPKISMSNSEQKLTSIYDQVYSSKVWKSILLTKFKVKKSWSKHKRDKKIRKYWKKALKKVKKLVRKYTARGWTYERKLWTWQVGTYKVSYQYYLQFSKTEYYTI